MNSNHSLSLRSGAARSIRRPRADARAALALGLLALWLVGCVTRPDPPLARFEFRRPEMGMPFRLVLYAPNPAVAQAAAEAAFARISQLNEIMSDYEDESELSRLSRTAGSGRSVPLSPDLWKVLARAQEISTLSDGAFDVTVGPYVNLWRRARRERELPSPDRLAQAGRAVGYRHLVLDPRTHSAQLLVPHMRLDLGGIAKGYALEEAIKVVRARGVTRALITGGGDMMAWDPPPGKAGWRIELAPLDVTNAPPARFVALRREALTTSGDLFQRLELGGRRYSHIVDPRTGIGLTDHSLVTIIARDATSADGFSKVVSVLGPAAGLRLVAAQPQVAACVVRQPGDRLETQETKGFWRHLEPGRR